ncbi:hypothetical protein D770_04705 [Flammeovirgaceae bacterium 311]|nr:hypothetical protein D770_04705 [Flammeovirgaceae bacterium 311]
MDGGGVYLLVFSGPPKRVIYVGTTNSFNRRINQHRVGILEGRRTIWRVDKGEDIYDLMSHRGKGNPYKYYLKLAKKRKLWATTTVDKEIVANDLVKKDNFEENWKDYVHGFYIHKIEILVLKTDFSQETNKRIESQIQTTLKDKHAIGSHIHSTGMCWLGKIEYTEDVYSTSYAFNYAPEISEEFKELFTNLGNKSYTNYRKPTKVTTRAERAANRQKEKEEYKFAQTPWLQEEDDVLRKCAALNVPKIDISKMLQRPLSEVNKRIQFFKKYNRI